MGPPNPLLPCCGVGQTLSLGTRSGRSPPRASLGGRRLSPTGAGQAPTFPSPPSLPHHGSDARPAAPSTPCLQTISREEPVPVSPTPQGSELVWFELYFSIRFCETLYQTLY